MLDVVAPPGFHAYVVAPEPDNVVLFPLQIVKEGEAVMVTVGVVLTETEIVPAALVHPLVLAVTE